MIDEISKKIVAISDEVNTEKIKQQKRELTIYLLLLLIFIIFGVVAIQKLVSQEKEIKLLASRPPVVLFDTIIVIQDSFDRAIVRQDSGLIISPRATTNTFLQRARRNTSITFDTKQTSLYFSIEAREASVLDSIKEIRYFSADASLDKQTLITSERYNNFFKEWETKRKPLPISITILYRDGKVEIDNITR